MITPFLLIPLAAVFQSGQQEPQLPQPERKVRIEIVTSENGETKRTTKEFDASNEEEMRDALRQMGVLEKMRLHDGERDITIDIRGRDTQHRSDFDTAFGAWDQIQGPGSIPAASGVGDFEGGKGR